MCSTPDSGHLRQTCFCHGVAESPLWVRAYFPQPGSDAWLDSSCQWELQQGSVGDGGAPPRRSADEAFVCFDCAVACLAGAPPPPGLDMAHGSFADFLAALNASRQSTGSPSRNHQAAAASSRDVDTLRHFTCGASSRGVAAAASADDVGVLRQSTGSALLMDHTAGAASAHDLAAPTGTLRQLAGSAPLFDHPAAAASAHDGVGTLHTGSCTSSSIDHLSAPSANDVAVSARANDVDMLCRLNDGTDQCGRDAGGTHAPANMMSGTHESSEQQGRVAGDAAGGAGDAAACDVTGDAAGGDVAADAAGGAGGAAGDSAGGDVAADAAGVAADNVAPLTAASDDNLPPSPGHEFRGGTPTCSSPGGAPVRTLSPERSSSAERAAAGTVGVRSRRCSAVGQSCATSAAASRHDSELSGFNAPTPAASGTSLSHHGTAEPDQAPAPCNIGDASPSRLTVAVADESVAATAPTEVPLQQAGLVPPALSPDEIRELKRQQSLAKKRQYYYWKKAEDAAALKQRQEEEPGERSAAHSAAAGKKKRGRKAAVSVAQQSADESRGTGVQAAASVAQRSADKDMRTGVLATSSKAQRSADKGLGQVTHAVPTARQGSKPGGEQAQSARDTDGVGSESDGDDARTLTQRRTAATGRPRQAGSTAAAQQDVTVTRYKAVPAKPSKVVSRGIKVPAHSSAPAKVAMAVKQPAVAAVSSSSSRQAVAKSKAAAAGSRGRQQGVNHTDTSQGDGKARGLDARRNAKVRRQRDGRETDGSPIAGVAKRAQLGSRNRNCGSTPSVVFKESTGMSSSSEMSADDSDDSDFKANAQPVGGAGGTLYSGLRSQRDSDAAAVTAAAHSGRLGAVILPPASVREEEEVAAAALAAAHSTVVAAALAAAQTAPSTAVAAPLSRARKGESALTHAAAVHERRDATARPALAIVPTVHGSCGAAATGGVSPSTLALHSGGVAEAPLSSIACRASRAGGSTAARARAVRGTGVRSRASPAAVTTVVPAHVPPAVSSVVVLPCAPPAVDNPAAPVCAASSVGNTAAADAHALTSVGGEAAVDHAAASSSAAMPWAGRQPTIAAALPWQLRLALDADRRPGFPAAALMGAVPHTPVVVPAALHGDLPAVLQPATAAALVGAAPCVSVVALAADPQGVPPPAVVLQPATAAAAAAAAHLTFLPSQMRAIGMPGWTVCAAGATGAMQQRRGDSARFAATPNVQQVPNVPCAAASTAAQVLDPRTALVPSLVPGTTLAAAPSVMLCPAAAEVAPAAAAAAAAAEVAPAAAAAAEVAPAAAFAEVAPAAATARSAVCLPVPVTTAVSIDVVFQAIAPGAASSISQSVINTPPPVAAAAVAAAVDTASVPCPAPVISHHTTVTATPAAAAVDTASAPRTALVISHPTSFAAPPSAVVAAADTVFAAGVTSCTDHIGVNAPPSAVAPAAAAACTVCFAPRSKHFTTATSLPAAAKRAAAAAGKACPPDAAPCSSHLATATAPPGSHASAAVARASAADDGTNISAVTDAPVAGVPASAAVATASTAEVSLYASAVRDVPGSMVIDVERPPEADRILSVHDGGSPAEPTERPVGRGTDAAASPLADSVWLTEVLRTARAQGRGGQAGDSGSAASGGHVNETAGAAGTVGGWTAPLRAALKGTDAMPGSSGASVATSSPSAMVTESTALTTGAALPTMGAVLASATAGPPATGEAATLAAAAVPKDADVQGALRCAAAVAANSNHIAASAPVVSHDTPATQVHPVSSTARLLTAAGSSLKATGLPGTLHASGHALAGTMSHAPASAAIAVPADQVSCGSVAVAGEDAVASGFDAAGPAESSAGRPIAPASTSRVAAATVQAVVGTALAAPSVVLVPTITSAPGHAAVPAAAAAVAPAAPAAATAIAAAAATATAAAAPAAASAAAAAAAPPTAPAAAAAASAAGAAGTSTYLHRLGRQKCSTLVLTKAMLQAPQELVMQSIMSTVLLPLEQVTRDAVTAKLLPPAALADAHVDLDERAAERPGKQQRTERGKIAAPMAAPPPPPAAAAAATVASANLLRATLIKPAMTSSTDAAAINGVAQFSASASVPANQANVSPVRRATTAGSPLKAGPIHRFVAPTGGSGMGSTGAPAAADVGGAGDDLVRGRQGSTAAAVGPQQQQHRPSPDPTEALRDVAKESGLFPPPSQAAEAAPRQEPSSSLRRLGQAAGHLDVLQQGGGGAGAAAAFSAPRSLLRSLTAPKSLLHALVGEYKAQFSRSNMSALAAPRGGATGRATPPLSGGSFQLQPSGDPSVRRSVRIQQSTPRTDDRRTTSLARPHTRRSSPSPEVIALDVPEGATVQGTGDVPGQGLYQPVAGLTLQPVISGSSAPEQLGVGALDIVDAATAAGGRSEAARPVGAPSFSDAKLSSGSLLESGPAADNAGGKADCAAVSLSITESLVFGARADTPPSGEDEDELPLMDLLARHSESQAAPALPDDAPLVGMPGDAVPPDNTPSVGSPGDAGHTAAAAAGLQDAGMHGAVQGQCSAAAVLSDGDTALEDAGHGAVQAPRSAAAVQSDAATERQGAGHASAQAQCSGVVSQSNEAIGSHEAGNGAVQAPGSAAQAEQASMYNRAYVKTRHNRPQFAIELTSTHISASCASEAAPNAWQSAWGISERSPSISTMPPQPAGACKGVVDGPAPAATTAADAEQQQRQQLGQGSGVSDRPSPGCATADVLRRPVHDMLVPPLGTAAATGTVAAVECDETGGILTPRGPRRDPRLPSPRAMGLRHQSARMPPRSAELPRRASSSSPLVSHTHSVRSHAQEHTHTADAFGLVRQRQNDHSHAAASFAAAKELVRDEGHAFWLPPAQPPQQPPQQLPQPHQPPPPQPPPLPPPQPLQQSALQHQPNLQAAQPVWHDVEHHRRAPSHPQQSLCASAVSHAQDVYWGYEAHWPPHQLPQLQPLESRVVGLPHPPQQPHHTQPGLPLQPPPTSSHLWPSVLPVSPREWPQQRYPQVRYEPPPLLGHRPPHASQHTGMPAARKISHLVEDGHRTVTPSCHPRWPPLQPAAAVPSEAQADSSRSARPASAPRQSSGHDEDAWQMMRGDARGMASRATSTFALATQRRAAVTTQPLPQRPSCAPRTCSTGSRSGLQTAGPPDYHPPHRLDASTGGVDAPWLTSEQLQRPQQSQPPSTACPHLPPGVAGSPEPHLVLNAPWPPHSPPQPASLPQSSSSASPPCDHHVHMSSQPLASASTLAIAPQPSHPADLACVPLCVPPAPPRAPAAPIVPPPAPPCAPPVPPCAPPPPPPQGPSGPGTQSRGLAPAFGLRSALRPARPVPECFQPGPHSRSTLRGHGVCPQKRPFDEASDARRTVSPTSASAEAAAARAANSAFGRAIKQPVGVEPHVFQFQATRGPAAPLFDAFVAPRSSSMYPAAVTARRTSSTTFQQDPDAGAGPATAARRSGFDVTAAAPVAGLASGSGWGEPRVKADGDRMPPPQLAVHGRASGSEDPHVKTDADGMAPPKRTVHGPPRPTGPCHVKPLQGFIDDGYLAQASELTRRAAGGELHVVPPMQQDAADHAARVAPPMDLAGAVHVAPVTDFLQGSHTGGEWARAEKRRSSAHRAECHSTADDTHCATVMDVHALSEEPRGGRSAHPCDEVRRKARRTDDASTAHDCGEQIQRTYCSAAHEAAAPSERMHGSSRPSHTSSLPRHDTASGDCHRASHRRSSRRSASRGQQDDASPRRHRSSQRRSSSRHSSHQHRQSSRRRSSSQERQHRPRSSDRRHRSKERRRSSPAHHRSSLPDGGTLPAERSTEPPPPNEISTEPLPPHARRPSKAPSARRSASHSPLRPPHDAATCSHRPQADRQSPDLGESQRRETSSKSHHPHRHGRSDADRQRSARRSDRSPARRSGSLATPHVRRLSDSGGRHAQPSAPHGSGAFSQEATRTPRGRSPGLNDRPHPSDPPHSSSAPTPRGRSPTVLDPSSPSLHPLRAACEAAAHSSHGTVEPHASSPPQHEEPVACQPALAAEAGSDACVGYAPGAVLSCRWAQASESEPSDTANQMTSSCMPRHNHRRKAEGAADQAQPEQRIPACHSTADAAVSRSDKDDATGGGFVIKPPVHLQAASASRNDVPAHDGEAGLVAAPQCREAVTEHLGTGDGCSTHVDVTDAGAAVHNAQAPQSSTCGASPAARSMPVSPSATNHDDVGASSVVADAAFLSLLLGGYESPPPSPPPASQSHPPSPAPALLPEPSPVAAVAPAAPAASLQDTEHSMSVDHASCESSPRAEVPASPLQVDESSQPLQPGPHQTLLQLDTPLLPASPPEAPPVAAAEPAPDSALPAPSTPATHATLPSPAGPAEAPLEAGQQAELQAAPRLSTCAMAALEPTGHCIASPAAASLCPQPSLAGAGETAMSPVTLSVAPVTVPTVGTSVCAHGDESGWEDGEVWNGGVGGVTASGIAHSPPRSHRGAAASAPSAPPSPPTPEHLVVPKLDENDASANDVLGQSERDVEIVTPPVESVLGAVQPPLHASSHDADRPPRCSGGASPSSDHPLLLPLLPLARRPQHGESLQPSPPALPSPGAALPTPLPPSPASALPLMADAPQPPPPPPPELSCPAAHQQHLPSLAADPQPSLSLPPSPSTALLPAMAAAAPQSSHPPCSSAPQQDVSLMAAAPHPPSLPPSEAQLPCPTAPQQQPSSMPTPAASSEQQSPFAAVRDQEPLTTLPLPPLASSMQQQQQQPSSPTASEPYLPPTLEPQQQGTLVAEQFMDGIPCPVVHADWTVDSIPTAAAADLCVNDLMVDRPLSSFLAAHTGAELRSRSSCHFDVPPEGPALALLRSTPDVTAGGEAARMTADVMEVEVRQGPPSAARVVGEPGEQQELPAAWVERQHAQPMDLCDVTRAAVAAACPPSSPMPVDLLEEVAVKEPRPEPTFASLIVWEPILEESDNSSRGVKRPLQFSFSQLVDLNIQLSAILAGVLDPANPGVPLVMALANLHHIQSGDEAVAAARGTANMWRELNALLKRLPVEEAEAFLQQYVARFAAHEQAQQDEAEVAPADGTNGASGVYGVRRDFMHKCDAFFTGQCESRRQRKEDRLGHRHKGEDVYVFAGVYMRNSESLVGPEVDAALNALPDQWSPRYSQTNWLNQLSKGSGIKTPWWYLNISTTVFGLHLEDFYFSGLNLMYNVEFAADTLEPQFEDVRRRLPLLQRLALKVWHIWEEAPPAMPETPPPNQPARGATASASGAGGRKRQHPLATTSKAKQTSQQQQHPSAKQQSKAAGAAEPAQLLPQNLLGLVGKVLVPKLYPEFIQDGHAALAKRWLYFNPAIVPKALGRFVTAYQVPGTLVDTRHPHMGMGYAAGLQGAWNGCHEARVQECADFGKQVCTQLRKEMFEVKLMRSDVPVARRLKRLLHWARNEAPNSSVQQPFGLYSEYLHVLRHVAPLSSSQMVAGTSSSSDPRALPTWQLVDNISDAVVAVLSHEYDTVMTARQELLMVGSNAMSGGARANCTSQKLGFCQLCGMELLARYFLFVASSSGEKLREGVAASDFVTCAACAQRLAALPSVAKQLQHADLADQEVTAYTTVMEARDWAKKQKKAQTAIERRQQQQR